MINATLTPRRPGPDVPEPGQEPWYRRLTLPAVALAVLVLLTLVVAFVYPTYPNYDSVYSLLWGRELLHGVSPSFDAYRAPTEHPLAIAFGAFLSLFGAAGDRMMTFAALASFVFLAVGVYRLGRAAFTPLVGLAGAVILCTRLNFPFLAVRGYIDVTYLAFVVWAAVWESERPRQGLRVPLLLAGAAMMRPEAWILAGLYFLYAAWPADTRRRLQLLVLAGVGPVVWVVLDFAVTGNPVFSLKHTSGLAEELGRTKSASQVPAATYEFLKSLDTGVVFAAGLLGIALAVWFVPRRVLWPLVLFVVGVGTFFLVGGAGLSVIDRYLLVPSVMLMLFAGVTVAGWTMLQHGRLRTLWIVAAVGVVAFGAAKTTLQVNHVPILQELRFRGDSYHALRAILKDPAVQKARRCGPISTPSHKLIPDVRWILDAPADQVLARSQHPDNDVATRRGLALLVTERQVLLRQALVEDTDDPLDNLPPAGFRRLAYNGTYAIYSSC